MKLVIVSIGLPEKGKALCEHLGVEDGESFVVVDPTNSLYNNLDLNRAWQGPSSIQRLHSHSRIDYSAMARCSQMS